MIDGPHGNIQIILTESNHFLIEREILIDNWVNICTIKKSVIYKVREFLDLSVSWKMKLLKWILKDMEKSFKMLDRYRSNHESLLKMKTS